MATYDYKLAYKDADEFIADVGASAFKKGTRMQVKLSDNTSYVFTYIDSRGDRINGLSSVRGNHMVIIDLETMTLSEQADA